MSDLTWPIASATIVALIILIGALALWRKLQDKKSGFPAVDERTQKLNWRAGYYSMYLLQYFILAFLAFTIIGQEFFSMPEFEAGYPMIAALLVSSVSFIVLRRYLGRKGEI